MAIEDELVTAVMTIMKELMSMSRDMLNMLKVTIDVVNHHQEQLTFLQLQGSTSQEEPADQQIEARTDDRLEKKQIKRKAPRNKNQKSKKGKWASEGGCKRCGRNHEAKNCPWTTGSCFSCGEKGHLIANCPKKTKGRFHKEIGEEEDNISYMVQDNDEEPMY